MNTKVMIWQGMGSEKWRLFAGAQENINCMIDLVRLLHEFYITHAISAFEAETSAPKVSAQCYRTLLKVNPSTRRKTNPEQAP